MNYLRQGSQTKSFILIVYRQNDLRRDTQLDVLLVNRNALYVLYSHSRNYLALKEYIKIPDR